MLKEKDLMKSEGSEEKPPTACVSGSSSVKWVIMVVARAAVPGNNNTIAVLALAVWCLNTGTLPSSYWSFFPRGGFFRQGFRQPHH